MRRCGRLPGLAVVLLVAGWVVLAPRPARAQRRAIVILLPQLDGEALAAELSRGRWLNLRRDCAVGLITTVTPLPRSWARSALTLGSGSAITAPADLGWPLRRDAPLESDSAVAVALHPNWAGMRGSRAGVVATALRQSGVETAYFGPAGGGDVLVSPAALAALDENGAIPRISVLRPPGDADGLVDQIRAAASRDQLLWVDVGPRSPGEAVALVEALSAVLNADTDVLALVGATADGMRPGEPERLAGVLLWGRQWAGQGLWSPTTRTPGLIANTDLAPTLMAHFGVDPPAGVPGRAAAPRSGWGAREVLAQARQAHRARQALVPTVLIWAAWAVVAVGLAIGMARHAGGGVPAARKRVVVARSALAGVIVFPLAVLIASAAIPGELPVFLLCMMAVAVGLTWLCGWLGRNTSPCLPALVVTSAGILVNMLVGGGLLGRGVLGNFAITGVRFYGVGNEYAGVMLATGLLSGGALLHYAPSSVWTRRGVVGMWVALPVILGLPMWGANFGAGVAAAVGSLASWRLLRRRRVRWSEVGLLLLAAVAAGVILWQAHRWLGGGASHVGQLAERVGEDGWPALREVIVRKALLNWRMATTWPFLAGLAVLVPALGLWYHLVGGMTRTALEHRPGLRAALWGTVAGAGVGLVVNDTGVILAALALCVALVAALDAVLDDLHTDRMRAVH